MVSFHVEYTTLTFPLAARERLIRNDQNLVIFQKW